MNIPTILDTIGHTPLVKLQHLVPNPLATVLAKMEFLNPGGSIKDRIVLHIIDDARKARFAQARRNDHRKYFGQHRSRCSHDRCHPRL